MSSPIDQLSGNVLHAFEQPAGLLNMDLISAIRDGLLSAEIHLHEDDSSPRAPRVVRNEGRNGELEPAYIELHRPHLELLWAFIFGWFVLYEEAVQKPLLAKSFTGPIVLDSALKQRAAQLLSWATGLKDKYTRWPQNLPSPSLSTATSVEEREYSAKVNGIFQEAIAFMLYHEFAHIFQGHLDVYDRAPTPEASALTKQLEREADDFAFRIFVMETDGDDVRCIKGWAVLSASLSSLYLIDSPAAIFQERHPHLHHRVAHALSQLNFSNTKDRDYYWYLCSVVLTVFAKAHNLGGANGRLAPEVFDTALDAVNAQLDELDALED